MSEMPEINAQRRRKGSRPTSQAEAPRREEQGGQQQGSFSGGFPPSSPPPSSGGFGPSQGSTGGSPFGSGGSSGGAPFGGGLPIGGKGGLGCGLIILLIICVLAFVFLSGGLGNLLGDALPQVPEQQQAVSTLPPQEIVNTPVQQQPVAPMLPTRTPAPTRAPSTSGQTGDRWLVMLYQDADDQALEQDIVLDLNEVEKVGSTDNVTIVTQLDRFRGGFAGSDNWSSTRRYLVTEDHDLNRIGSQLIEDLGEANMADGQTLADFVTWAIQTYPADKYALIMSDHGMGWPGGWSDPDPSGADSGKAPLISMLRGDSIFLAEMDEAFNQIQQNTGVEKLDLIGMDACLMSQMEIYAMLEPYARVAVASEETEPGLGWAYTAFLQQLVDDPAMDARTLGAHIVETYIDDDQRIVDDTARNEFLNQSRGYGGFFGTQTMSAAQLADQLSRNITLTAVDLEAFPAAMTAFNEFIYRLQDVDQGLVAQARSYTQSYTSIFGREVPPSYIDVGHFTQLIGRNVQDNAVVDSARNFLTAYSNILIAEKHGSSKPGSTGVAFYFPNSTLYRSPYTGLKSYSMLADTFVRTSLWDDFLVYHYNDRPFQRTAAEPLVAPDSITRAPGSGNISIANLVGSASSVAPGDYVTVSAEITGEKIGYIYWFAGYYDQQSNSILIADTDYLESGQDGELSGVYYPVWPDQTFKLNFEWGTELFVISDGNTKAIAHLKPTVYGANEADAIYVVEGTYTFGDTGEARKAELLFKNEKLYQVYGFKDGDLAGQPAEITPNVGDSFTVVNRWIELDTSGYAQQTVSEDGQTLTFSGKPFTWEQQYAPSGEYVVGFIVGDLDGNNREAFTKVTVE